MPPLVYLILAIKVILDTGGQLAFKKAAVDTGDKGWRELAKAPWLWFGLGCFVIEFCAWIAFLSLVPLSSGVLLGSVNIVAMMVAGRWLFGERLNFLGVSGILLVASGVAIVGVGG